MRYFFLLTVLFTLIPNVYSVAQESAAAPEAAATSVPPEPVSQQAPDAAVPPEPPPSQPFSEALRVQHVAGNIYMLEGRGGNIAVSTGPDGLLMVDTEYQSESEKVQEALASIGPGELKYVLNTHWHRDHTEGNHVFGPSAQVIAQEHVRPRLEKEGYAAGALPEEQYDTLKELRFNGENIRLVHASNGHTDGDSIVFFTGSNVVHMGDQFFSGRFPFIDLDSGGSISGYIQNVEQTIQQLPEDALIIPGHGPLSDLQDLRDFHEMLEATRDIVDGQRLQGLGMEAVVAQGLPTPWSTWAWDLIPEKVYLEILYKGLSRPPVPGK